VVTSARLDYVRSCLAVISIADIPIMIPRIQSEIGRRLVRFAAFEIAFLIAYRYGNLSRDFASPFWFPDSVLLAALLVTDRRNWWLYVLGPLPIRLLLFADLGMPFWFLLVSFINDSLKALLSAWALSSISASPRWFESLRDFGRYLLIAVF